MSARISCLLAAATVIITGPALAEETQQTLRVCASTKDAPYSTADGSGFENRIAQVIADQAKMTLDLVKIDKDAIYLVRDGIEQDLCDVLVGVDESDDRLLTSDPYYRTGYAFISREDRGLDSSFKCNV
jgi:mxaJ protein